MQTHLKLRIRVSSSCNNIPLHSPCKTAKFLQRNMCRSSLDTIPGSARPTVEPAVSLSCGQHEHVQAMRSPRLPGFPPVPVHATSHRFLVRALSQKGNAGLEESDWPVWIFRWSPATIQILGLRGNVAPTAPESPIARRPSQSPSRAHRESMACWRAGSGLGQSCHPSDPTWTLQRSSFLVLFCFCWVGCLV